MALRDGPASRGERDPAPSLNPRPVEPASARRPALRRSAAIPPQTARRRRSPGAPPTAGHGGASALERASPAPAQAPAQVQASATNGRSRTTANRDPRRVTAGSGGEGTQGHLSPRRARSGPRPPHVSAPARQSARPRPRPSSNAPLIARPAAPAHPPRPAETARTGAARAQRGRFKAPRRARHAATCTLSRERTSAPPAPPLRPG